MEKTDADEAGRDGAGQTGEGAAQHVGEQLGLDEVDAHALGHVLVLADGHPRAPEARAAQAPGDEGDDRREGEGDVVDLHRPGEDVRRRHGIGLGMLMMPCGPPRQPMSRLEPARMRMISPKPSVAMAR